eukprot:2995591-Prymnesium_polylepis.1
MSACSRRKKAPAVRRDPSLGAPMAPPPARESSTACGMRTSRVKALNACISFSSLRPTKACESSAIKPPIIIQSIE